MSQSKKREFAPLSKRELPHKKCTYNLLSKLNKDRAFKRLDRQSLRKEGGNYGC